MEFTKLKLKDDDQVCEDILGFEDLFKLLRELKN